MPTIKYESLAHIPVMVQSPIPRKAWCGEYDCWKHLRRKHANQNLPWPTFFIYSKWLLWTSPITITITKRPSNTLICMLKLNACPLVHVTGSINEYFLFALIRCTDLIGFRVDASVTCKGDTHEPETDTYHTYVQVATKYMEHYNGNDTFVCLNVNSRVTS